VPLTLMADRHDFEGCHWKNGIDEREHLLALRSCSLNLWVANS
jgi:hypothetical protein